MQANINTPRIFGMRFIAGNPRPAAPPGRSTIGIMAQSMTPSFAWFRMAASVLDVACGPGLLCRKIKQLWPATQVMGVDFSQFA